MRSKVVILSAFMHPFRSGAEACAEEVALALADQFDVHLVTARLRKSSLKKDSLRGRVSVTRIGFGNPLDKWLFPFLAPFVVRSLKPNIVHAVLESFAGMAMVFCSWIYKSKYILTCQSTNTSFMLKPMHKRAHKITTISWVLQERAKRLGRPDAILIPNGMPGEVITKALQNNHKIPGRILYAGRLEEMKGVDTLLQAFQHLLVLGADSHVHLHIVGDGSLRSLLEDQAQELGIKERVIFTGYLPFPDVYDEFAQAEIFCGLSRQEAFGNVFIEAQAAECAVIATNTQGIPDIVKDGETGLLVRVDNVEAAAKALQTFVLDSELRHRFAQAGKKYASQFDWHNIAHKYAAVYEEILGTD